MAPQKKRNKKPNNNNNNNTSKNNLKTSITSSGDLSTSKDDETSSVTTTTTTTSISLQQDDNEGNDSFSFSDVPQQSTTPSSEGDTSDQQQQSSVSLDNESSHVPTITIVKKEEEEKETTQQTQQTQQCNNINLESIYQIVNNISNNVNSIKERVVTDEEPDWREMYMIIQREFKMEKKKTELMETKVEELEQEKRLLNERIRLLESRVDNDKKRLVKTFGTIRTGTVRLLNASKGNNDLSTILKDLQNIENMDSHDSTFANKIGENADALLTKLKSFQDVDSSIVLNGSSTPLNGSLGDEFLNQLQQQSQQSSQQLLSGQARDALTKSSSENILDIQKIIKVQSFVRRYLVQKRFKRLKTKRLAVNELFETEITYVQHLTNLIRIFVNPLKQKIQSGEIQMSVTEVERIFSTLNTIVMSNSIFLKQTEDIFKHFNRWSVIGSRMLEQLPLFECYIDYIVNYEYSHQALKRAMTIPSFSQFVKNAEHNVELGDLDIADLLIMPVQRIPRYIMLIQQVRKYTSHDHPDYVPLTKASDAFKKFADGVNERKAMRSRAIHLDDRISGLKEELSAKLGSKYLIREGPIRFKKNYEYAFLLNDMILICHPTIKKTKVRSNSVVTNQLAASASSNSSSSTASVQSTLSTSTAPPSPKEDLTEIISFKFLSKIMLDGRVKIVEDSSDNGKWTTIIPDLYSIELTASSVEERQLWVKDIMNIISIFSNNLLNNSPVNTSTTSLQTSTK
ncbi:pleckstrin domain-containing protein [Cavenderia fasciculata]|uniref:Pleckstrin domain-containing protein n=1 Tax=Cavenderia fasciculata TaxID=261658 RepID=F4PTT8_CACFS|nr:pleckstrin domain-containing protein [Cavenderia fasciculata]EGG20917.1 pleckstrin domain-containing protein [Cavenderia fasciculata]|eukprot:XP_004358767.1 pleckstrin domain-containing protein [Cavenderia fasciculata]